MFQLTRDQLYVRAQHLASFSIPQADLYVIRRDDTGEERYALRHRGLAICRVQYAPRPPDWDPAQAHTRRLGKPTRFWRPAPVLLAIDLFNTTATFEVAFGDASDDFSRDGSVVADRYRCELYNSDGAGGAPGWFNRMIDDQIASLRGALGTFAAREGAGLRIEGQTVVSPPESLSPILLPDLDEP